MSRLGRYWEYCSTYQFWNSPETRANAMMPFMKRWWSLRVLPPIRRRDRGWPVTRFPTYGRARVRELVPPAGLAPHKVEHARILRAIRLLREARP